MGITVDWYDADETIIQWHFKNPWDWGDFHNAFKRSLELSESTDRRIDVIPYVGETSNIPPGLLTHFKAIENRMPNHVGMIIVTGAPKLTNMIIQTFNRLYRIKRWTTAATFEDALNMIAESRKVES